MQAQDDRAMPGLERADELAAVNDGASSEQREHRLERREQPTVVLKRQHRAIDHKPGEVHDAVGGCVHVGRCGLDVDSPVAAGVGRGGGEIGASDDARRVHGPQPARGRGRSSAKGHE
jgi:hypothetical protein